MVARRGQLSQQTERPSAMAFVGSEGSRIRSGSGAATAPLPAYTLGPARLRLSRRVSLLVAPSVPHVAACRDWIWPIERSTIVPGTEAPTGTGPQNNQMQLTSGGPDLEVARAFARASSFSRRSQLI